MTQQVLCKKENEIFCNNKRIGYYSKASTLSCFYSIIANQLNLKSRFLKKKAFLYLAYDGKCYWCQDRISLVYKSNKNLAFTIDHVKPTSKNGTDKILNIVSACQKCNTLRQNDYVNPHTKQPFDLDSELNKIQELLYKFVININDFNTFEHDLKVTLKCIKNDHDLCFENL